MTRYTAAGMAAGRHGTGVTVKSFLHPLPKVGGKERVCELGRAWVFGTSRPTSVTHLLQQDHFLITTKQFYQLGTKPLGPLSFKAGQNLRENRE